MHFVDTVMLLAWIRFWHTSFGCLASTCSTLMVDRKFLIRVSYFIIYTTVGSPVTFLTDAINSSNESCRKGRYEDANETKAIVNPNPIGSEAQLA